MTSRLRSQCIQPYNSSSAFALLPLKGLGPRRAQGCRNTLDSLLAKQQRSQRRKLTVACTPSVLSPLTHQQADTSECQGLHIVRTSGQPPQHSVCYACLPCFNDCHTCILTPDCTIALLHPFPIPALPELHVVPQKQAKIWCFFVFCCTAADLAAAVTVAARVVAAVSAAGAQT